MSPLTGRRPKVLAAGYLTTDLLLKVERFAAPDEEIPIQSLAEYQGGSAANTAVGLRRLGVPAALLASIGDDERGRQGVHTLASEGVDISQVVTSSRGAGSPYVVGVVEGRGERQLYAHAGAGAELMPEHLAAADLAEVTHLHICTLGPEFVERALAVVRGMDHEITISVDPGALGSGGDRALRLRPALPHLDLLFVNTLELRLLTDVTDVAQVARHADALPAALAIKLGPAGCVLYRRGERPVISRAFDVQVQDTTGAGDAFAAGYLAGDILGLSLEHLALFSNAVAALSTRVVGCRDGLPTLAEVLAFLRAHGVSIPSPC